MYCKFRLHVSELIFNTCMKTKIMCIFYTKVGTLSGAKLVKTKLRSVASEETTATKRQYARMLHSVVHAPPRGWK